MLLDRALQFLRFISVQLNENCLEPLMLHYLFEKEKYNLGNWFPFSICFFSLRFQFPEAFKDQEAHMRFI